METVKPVIECDGPTCREFTIKEEGKDLPEGWYTKHEKLHFHSTQCAALEAVMRTFGGPVPNSKSMTAATFLHYVANRLDPLPAISSALDEVLDISNEEDLLGVGETPTITAILFAILKKEPGPHTSEELIELAHKYGWELEMKQISPILSNKETQARYPELQVGKLEQEGKRSRNVYSYSGK